MASGVSGGSQLLCGWGLVPPSKCYLGDVGDNGNQAYLATVLAESAGRC